MTLKRKSAGSRERSRGHKKVKAMQRQTLGIAWQQVSDGSDDDDDDDDVDACFHDMAVGLGLTNRRCQTLENEQVLARSLEAGSMV